MSKASDEEKTDRATAILADGSMSVKEASKFSSVSRAELYLKMARGELPFIKWGRRRMIPRRALIEMMASKLVVAKQS